MVQMDYEPEGIKESVGSVVGADDRRVKKDLESFKEMIETSGRETGGWRGRHRELTAGEVNWRSERRCRWKA